MIVLILNLEDLFYPSEDLVEELEIFQKIHGETLDRGQEPMKRQQRKKLHYYKNRQQGRGVHEGPGPPPLRMPSQEWGNPHKKYFCPELKSFIKKALINSAFCVNISLIS